MTTETSEFPYTERVSRILPMLDDEVRESIMTDALDLLGDESGLASLLNDLDVDEREDFMTSLWQTYGQEWIDEFGDDDE